MLIGHLYMFFGEAYSSPLPIFEFLLLSYRSSLCILIINPLSNKWEKAMAPHSSTIAWKIPWTEEPGRLQSMGSLRVGHN